MNFFSFKKVKKSVKPSPFINPSKMDKKNFRRLFMPCLSATLGCVFGTVGVANVISNLVGINHKLGVEHDVVEGDSKAKKIARIVANVFALIGAFVLAWATFTIGASLLTLGASVGILGAMNAGILAALPKLMVAVGSLFAGVVLNRLGDGPKLATPKPLVERIRNNVQQFRRAL